MSKNTNTERTTERWVCAGRRMSTKGAVLHAWYQLDDVEREHLLAYAKVKGVAGGIYDVEVARDGDACVVYGDPSYVESLDHDNPERIEWEARERVDLTLIEQRRMEKNARSDSSLAELVAPLREQYAKQVGYARKAAVLAVVTELITR